MSKTHACPPEFPKPDRPATGARRSKSSLLYLMVLDHREMAARLGLQTCAACIGDMLSERGMRDRRYGHPKRYGMRTTVTTRRVDRVDPIRKLY